MEQKTFDPDGVGVDNGTYFGLPFEPETAELVIVSAPWDVTVSYGAGTAYAPDAIIEASTQLDFHEPLAPGAWRRGIATADVDYSLLDESQRLRGDAAKVIDHLEGGGSPEDDYVVRKICRVNEGCAAMNAHIGAQAAVGQGLGGLRRVGAEKLRVGHPVAGRVGLGVLHRGGDHLRPNGPPRLPGHDQGNGSNAAVEVQHRLPPCQPRKGQRPAIQNLRLLPVHLVKGGHGEPEGQAA